MRRRLHGLVALLGLVIALAPVPARAATATVEVRDNFFSPDVLEVDLGDTVTWNVIDGDHTVRSVDEVDGVPLFEFPAGAGTLRAGQSHSHVFSEAGAYPYFCEVHPGSMTGVVYVEVQPPSPAVRHVPADYDTIAAAVAGAPAGTTIEISPGVYREEVTVDEEDITLRGSGFSPADVVLDGGGTLNAGISAFAEGLRVENLTVRGYTSRGLYLRGADRFRIHRVHAVENGDHGIRVKGSRGGGITDSVADGSRIGGVSIAECDMCGTVVQGVTARANGTGILVENAGPVFVFASTLSANEVGIAVASPLPQPIEATATDAPARGAIIRGNTSIGNGTGLLVQGGWTIEVTHNHVDGGDVGVAIEGAPVPSITAAIRENTVTRYARAGITWDLLGADVCFSGNHDPRAVDGAPRTDPPNLQLLFAC